MVTYLSSPLAWTIKRYYKLRKHYPQCLCSNQETIYITMSWVDPNWGILRHSPHGRPRFHVCWREEISRLPWNKGHSVCFTNLQQQQQQQQQCCSLPLACNCCCVSFYTNTHKSWAVLIEDLISILLCWGRLLASASNNTAPDLNCLFIVPPINTGRFSQRSVFPHPTTRQSPPLLSRSRHNIRERLFTFSIAYTVTVAVVNLWERRWGKISFLLILFPCHFLWKMGSEFLQLSWVHLRNYFRINRLSVPVFGVDQIFYICLRHCTTNRKVAGSIPNDGHWDKSWT